MVKPDWEATRKELIDTYKTLNFKVRGIGEDKLTADHGGDSIRAEIAGMRQHELIFAKSLTNALLGDTSGKVDESDTVNVTGAATSDEPTDVLISQFGNARATTLNTISSLDDEAWDKTTVGNKRVHDLAKELADSDRAHLDKITRMLGA